MRKGSFQADASIGLPGADAACVIAGTEKTWAVLESAIHEINNHNASGLSFEELYRHDDLQAPHIPSQLSGLPVTKRSITFEVNVLRPSC
jgi:hypothetical protein